MKPKFSVLMPVYRNDNPEYLKEAIESLKNQTLQADEIIVVVDGEIGKDLNDILTNYIVLTVHYFGQNRGLGKVLADGVLLCKNDLIARMDADDISYPERFERQIECFENNPEIDVLGGYISEFKDDYKNIVRDRKVPMADNEIYSFSKKRNPMNHVTVMFKKSSVLEAGNYQDMLYFEDYYLWMRMIYKGYKLRNINKNLVNVRIAELDSRRGGISYIKKEVLFYRTLFKENIITFGVYIANLITRVPVRLLGSKFRHFIYEKFLRK